MFLSHVQEEELRSLQIDLFFNISSFQEMTESAISKYFSVIRENRALLYCMNREEKVLVEEGPIRFEDYPWDGAEMLMRGSANWHWTSLHWSRPFVRRIQAHQFAVARLP